MALQNTGPISLSDINVELGRSSTATISLSGSSERDLAGVPSGAIDVSDFYGASAVDNIPDALDWPNLFDLSSTPTASDSASDIVTGISGSIQIRAIWTGSISGGSGSFSLSGPGGTVAINSPGTTINLTVSNNDTVTVSGNLTADPNELAVITGSVSIENVSDGNTVLDTFNFDLSCEDVSGGGGS